MAAIRSMPASRTACRSPSDRAISLATDGPMWRMLSPTSSRCTGWVMDAAMPASSWSVFFGEVLQGAEDPVGAVDIGAVLADQPAGPGRDTCGTCGRPARAEQRVALTTPRS